MRDSKILVTGGSGLIGMHLRKLLLADGANVISLARSYPVASPGGIEIEGDIRNPALLGEVLANHTPTHLVHLAAQPIVGNALTDAESTFDINIRGTWLVLEAARKYGKLQSIVIASSDKAYGQHSVQPYREDFELKAQYPYDISKQASEQLALSYYHTHGLPISITRCGNAFGAYDLNLSRIVPGTIVSCLKNKDIVIRSSGQLKRCYIYAADIADAYLKLLAAPRDKVAGQAFNIGNPDAVSVLEMVKHIQAAIPESTSKVMIQNNAFGEIEQQSLDCSKISRILGWQPKTTMQEALRETINWYRESLPVLPQ